MDKRYFCKDCKYKWESKKKFGEPSICPKCKKDNIIHYSKTEEYRKEQERLREVKHNFLLDLKNLMKKEEQVINDKWFWSKSKKEEEIKRMKEDPYRYFIFRLGPIHKEAQNLDKKYNGWYIDIKS